MVNSILSRGYAQHKLARLQSGQPVRYFSSLKLVPMVLRVWGRVALKDKQDGLVMFLILPSDLL